MLVLEGFQELFFLCLMVLEICVELVLNLMMGAYFPGVIEDHSGVPLVS